MSSKQSIFISHATHEDDYQAGWLASKLDKLGYSIFVDFTDVRAGDTFYTKIQPEIQLKSSKFITLNTHNYIAKAKDTNSGVRKEINTATTVRDDINFIIPVRFDNIKFDDFPMEYLGRKVIDFNNRWGAGLLELVQELEILSVPKSNESPNPLSLWHQALQSRTATIQEPENIYLNWFGIKLPHEIFIHRPEPINKKDLIRIPSTMAMDSDRIISFTPTESFSKLLPLISSFKFDIESAVQSQVLSCDDGYSLVKPQDKVKILLNKMFNYHCRSNGLQRYIQSGKKEVYYFSLRNLSSPFVSLKHLGRTRIGLTGNKWKTNWHFGIDGKISLHPFPHYTVAYHIIFSDKEYKPLGILDQHKLRRRFSAALYNKKAFELLLGAMYLLADKTSNVILMKIDTDNFLEVNPIPISTKSNTSYIEPDGIYSDDIS